MNKYDSLRCCCHVGCYNADKKERMCEIVFGVHPNVVKERNKKLGEAVITVKSSKFFCKNCAPFYKDITYALIASVADPFQSPYEIEVLKENPRVIGEALFKEGYGCWITVHDRTIAGEPIQNFQLPYGRFEKIVQGFPPVDYPYASNLEEAVERVKNLKFTAHLSEFPPI